MGVISSLTVNMSYARQSMLCHFVYTISRVHKYPVWSMFLLFLSGQCVFLFNIQPIRIPSRKPAINVARGGKSAARKLTSQFHRA